MAVKSTVKFRIRKYLISFFAIGVVTIYEEYLIYDFIGMVASVGGTIGMFIGFSFRDVFTVVFDNLRCVLFSKN